MTDANGLILTVQLYLGAFWSWTPGTWILICHFLLYYFGQIVSFH